MFDPSPSNLPDPLPQQSRRFDAPQTPLLPAGYITPISASAPESCEARRNVARLRAALARADEDGNPHVHWEALVDAGLLGARPAPASPSGSAPSPANETPNA